jgi:hypothetical protein
MMQQLIATCLGDYMPLSEILSSHPTEALCWSLMSTLLIYAFFNRSPQENERCWMQSEKLPWLFQGAPKDRELAFLIAKECTTHNDGTLETVADISWVEDQSQMQESPTASVCALLAPLL